MTSPPPISPAGDRDQLLAAVRARLGAFGQNPAIALSPQTTVLVSELLRSVADAGTDLEVLHVAGSMAWCRYLVSDPSEDRAALNLALELLGPVHRAPGYNLPGTVSRYLDGTRPIGEPGMEKLLIGGVFLLQEAERLDDDAMLDEAIPLLRLALDEFPDGHPDRAGFLNNFGAGLYSRFKRRGAAADLDEAIRLYQAAVQTAPGYHYRIISSLGDALQSRFELTDSPADLDMLIDIRRRASVAVPDGSRDRGWILWRLARALRTRSERFGQPTDDGEAVLLLLEAFALAPEDASAQERTDVAEQFRRHAGRLWAQATDTGDWASLDQAIGLLRNADALLPADSVERGPVLSDLGVVCLVRFHHAGESADLDQALAAAEKAVAVTPADHGDRPTRLFRLSLVLAERFNSRGTPADLDQAIVASAAAVATMPYNEAALVPALATRAEVLKLRFQLTGDVADLEQSVLAAEQCEQAAPADLPVGRSALRDALLVRYQSDGADDDLARVVELSRQSLDATPVDRPEVPLLQSDLAVALGVRFERFADPADLDEALRLARQALAALPIGFSTRGEILSRLAKLLYVSFQRTGDLADLDEGVDLSRQALEAVPARSLSRAGYVTNLGLVLRHRFDRTGEVADLDDAIDLSRRAVAGSWPGQPDHALLLTNLGRALLRRVAITGALRDLDEAVEVSEQAVAAATTYRRSHGLGLVQLGRALTARYVAGGAGADLERAVIALEEAVAATGSDAVERAHCLRDLELALRLRFGRGANPADSARAVAVCREAMRVEAAPALVRALAASRYGAWSAMREEWTPGVEGFTAAVEFLSRVAPRSLARSDQEYALSQLVPVGSNAAACCLEVNEIERAVELFERGRNVLFSQTLDLRADLSELSEQYPALAEQFTRLGDELAREPDPDAQRTGTDSARGAFDRAARDRRRQLTRDFEDLIGDVRTRPGFARFLLPLPVKDLLASARDGPVILLNVSQIRSDALILTRAGVEVLPLPEMTPAAVRERVDLFLAAVDQAQDPAASSETRDEAETRLSEILRWLWDVVTGPVLDRLGIFAGPGDGQPWPRIWWCASGLLTLLPVHAAGDHDTRFQPSPRTALDRIASSYTATIRGLIHARRPRHTASGSARPKNLTGQLLVVAMPHTPQAADLPGAEAETALLRGLLPGAYVLEGPVATHASVATALPRYRWAHFACHGLSDLTNPSVSHLLLTDHQDAPLTVLAVAALRLEEAELAFLSACSTGQTGTNLPDESIHLATAFHLAGYRHVISTLWPIGDRPAVQVARHLYQMIVVDEGAAKVDNVAVALHCATRRLRAVLPQRVTAWATHTHTGA